MVRFETLQLSILTGFHPASCYSGTRSPSAFREALQSIFAALAPKPEPMKAEVLACKLKALAVIWNVCASWVTLTLCASSSISFPGWQIFDRRPIGFPIYAIDRFWVSISGEFRAIVLYAGEYGNLQVVGRAKLIHSDALQMASQRAFA
jgi:hypothetical protein